MKRDFEVIRDILRMVERSNGPLFDIDEISDASRDLVIYNVVLLDEAGLIIADWEELSDYRLIVNAIHRLTWEGHEFLDAAKNKGVWNKTREYLRQRSSDVPFHIFQNLLIKFLNEAIIQ